MKSSEELYLASLFFSRELNIFLPSIEGLQNILLRVLEEIVPEPCNAHEVDGQRLHVPVHLASDHEHWGVPQNVGHALREARLEELPVVHQDETVELRVGRDNGRVAEEVWPVNFTVPTKL